MSMSPVVIKAFNIPDAWFQAVHACMNEGTYERAIFHGSRQNERRKEIDWLIIRITNPSNRPLFPDVPGDVPPPSSDEAINTYLEYIATPGKAGDSSYTYGRRTHGSINLEPAMLAFMEKHDRQEGKNIHKELNQFDVIADFLKKTPETNRAFVEVGMAQDLMLEDPPCLRAIHFKIRYRMLHMFVVFRSWDIWAGMPVNLGGYQKLKESLVNDLNLYYTDMGMHKIQDGEILASSLGAHIYSRQWGYAKQVVERSASSKMTEMMKKRVEK